VIVLQVTDTTQRRRTCEQHKRGDALALFTSPKSSTASYDALVRLVGVQQIHNKWKQRSLRLYTVSGKKRPCFFLHNFNTCRHSFVIFGTNHHEDSFY